MRSDRSKMGVVEEYDEESCTWRVRFGDGPNDIVCLRPDNFRVSSDVTVGMLVTLTYFVTASFSLWKVNDALQWSEGDRCVLPEKDRGGGVEPEQRGEILSLRDCMAVVVVDDEYVGEDDDGIREVFILELRRD